MKIRIKFFAILLSLSLMPLLVITVISRQSITRLGDELSRDARDHQSASVSAELVQSARVSADAISRYAASLELSLGYLADSAVHALALPPPPPEARIYTPEDFRRPETAPEDLEMSWRYARATEEGVVMPSAVSTRYPVVVHPAGQRDLLAPRMRRLAGLAPVFRKIYRMNSGVVHRVYVGLESGVHISFPGHGHLSAAFDPRQQPWFIAARTLPQGASTWLSHRDTTTRKLVFTVAAPLHDASGRFLGVAAIDMLPAEFMQMDQLRSQWSRDTRAFLVMPGDAASTAGPDLRIIASGFPGDPAEDTGGQSPKATFAFADSAQQQKLMDALQAATSGTLALPYGNEPSIWAFVRFRPLVENTLWMILIVPEHLISSLSGEIAQEVLDQTHRIYRITGVIAAALLLLVLLVAWIGTRTILRPLYAMVHAWKRLSTGDFSVRLHVRANDERDVLIDAFNEIVPRLEAQWHQSQSMELARQIQRNLLPHQPPRLPGLELAGDSRYCDETGGDYYDMFLTGKPGDNRMAVVVGDVSGHGVASALLMTTARAMIRSMSVFEPDVARRITLVNRLLVPDTTDTADFITMFYLECDLGRRRLSWVRAGHDPALLYDPHEDRFSELTGEGMALGISADYTFSAAGMPLGAPGGIILVGTDGIWEAHDPQGDMFGKERLRRIVRHHSTSSAGAIRDAVFRAVEDFRGPRQEDDITLAVIKLL